jgi:predicted histone-like DNA-binding protein
MAVLLNVYQDNRKNSNKLFYARTVNASTVDTKALAKRISQNTTVTYADCVAVLYSLVAVMNNELANSNRIHLDGFGIFSVGVKTSGALAREEWNIRENLRGAHMNFQPTRTADGATGQTTSKSMGFGYKAQVIDVVPKPTEEEEGE